jgi:hypothetical protein
MTASATMSGAALHTCATSLNYPLPTLHRTLDISTEIDFHGALVLDQLPAMPHVRKERY